MHAATCGQQPSVVAPSLPSNHSPWPASTAARNMMPGWRSFCGKAAAIRWSGAISLHQCRQLLVQD